jgi:hypothetical protein
MRTGGEDDSLMKFWAWDKKNLPSNHTRHSRSSCRDGVGHYRAAGANARGVLGRDRDFGRHAIHRRRDTDAVDRANRRHRSGCVSWSTRGKLLQSKSGRVRSRDFSRRIAAHRISFGEDRISLREHYPHCSGRNIDGFRPIAPPNRASLAVISGLTKKIHFGQIDNFIAAPAQNCFEHEYAKAGCLFERNRLNPVGVGIDSIRYVSSNQSRTAKRSTNR